MLGKPVGNDETLVAVSQESGGKAGEISDLSAHLEAELALQEAIQGVAVGAAI
jgi:hypothetical protein